MKAKELIEALEDCDPEAKVKIDPPHSDVKGVVERDYKKLTVVELRH